MSLSEVEEELLEKALAWGNIRVQGNIKKIPGWREGIKGLEDKDLLVRVNYGIFEPTDKAEKNRLVACEDCGATGSSREDLPPSMWCRHDNLCYQLEKYG